MAMVAALFELPGRKQIYAITDIWDRLHHNIDESVDRALYTLA